MKKILLVVCALMLAVPSKAVLNEKNLDETLVVLRGELDQAIKKQQQNMARYRQYNASQKKTLKSTMDRCGEVSLMLYSQNPDYVFDLTYACNEATELYRNFMTVNKKPYDLINARITSEIKRYDGLIFSLKCLPPALIQMKGKRRLHTPDTLSLSAQADRAACIQSAMQLRDNIVKTQRLITADSIAFSHVSTILGKLNTYAQKRYDDIQSSIFRDNGSTNSKFWAISVTTSTGPSSM